MGYKDKNYRHHDNSTEQQDSNENVAITEEEVIDNNSEEEVIETVEESKKEEETKMEEVKTEEKKEDVVSTSDDSFAIKKKENEKKIEELKDNIKSWEAQIKISRNNIVNAELHDNIMQARKEITKLSSELPPSEVVQIKYATMSDKNANIRKKPLEDINDHIIRII